VNTVYFIDTTGTACPHGTGLPVPGAALPTSPIAFDPAGLQTKGVTPYNMGECPGPAGRVGHPRHRGRRLTAAGMAKRG
jgi:hypothetical protein